jgi:hypothetical protein
MTSKHLVRRLALFFILLIVFGCKPRPELQPPLPDGAPVYLCKIHFADNWDKFTSTKFSQAVCKLDLWQDPAIRIKMKKIQALVEELEADSGIPMNKDTFMTVFGHRVDVAVYPGDPLADMVLVSDLESRAPVIKILDFFQKELGSAKVTTEKYKSVELTDVSVEPDITLSYFFQDDRLICSTSPELAKRCIDVMKKDAPSFFKADLYTSTRSMSDPYDNHLIVDVSKCADILKRVAPDLDVQSKLSAAEYDRLVLGFNLSETGLDAAAHLIYPGQSPVVDVFKKGFDADLLKWIPGNPLGVSAAVVKLPAMLDYQKQKLEEIGKQQHKDHWGALTAWLQTTCSIDLETELKPVLGNGSFATIHRINTEGMFPMPETVIGISTVSRKEAEILMHKIEGSLTASLSEKHVQFQSITIDDLEYRYIPLPFGPNLSPGYAIADSYILLATSQNGMKESWSAYNGKQSNLTNSDDLKIFSNLAKRKSIGFQYLNTAQLFQALSDLVNNYRLFFPKDLNPDHVQAALKTCGLIDSYFADVKMSDSTIESHFSITMQ